MIENYLIGSDIEVFLKQGDEIISAEGLIKGTKNTPFKLGRKGCSTSLDNISAEFTVNPTTNPEEMWADIQFCLSSIQKGLPAGVTTAIQASAHLKRGLDTPNAKLIGCEPDWCVYTREINIKPDISELDLRVSAGHIHIGTKVLKGNLELCEKVIKALDVYIGLPSVLLDSDRERRALYGKAGCVRFPEHGVEYRTPSNFWASSLDLVRWMFQNVELAIDSVNNGVSFEEDEEFIIEAINNYDENLTKDLIRKYNVPIKGRKLVAQLPDLS